jgi:hypothetical protein
MEADPKLPAIAEHREADMINLSPETLELSKRLAAAQGISVEEAIKQAVAQCALAVGVIERTRDTSPEAIARRKAETQRIIDEISALPVLDPRPWREILDDVLR